MDTHRHHDWWWDWPPGSITTGNCWKSIPSWFRVSYFNMSLSVTTFCFCFCPLEQDHWFVKIVHFQVMWSCILTKPYFCHYDCISYIQLKQTINCGCASDKNDSQLLSLPNQQVLSKSKISRGKETVYIWRSVCICTKLQFVKLNLIMVLLLQTKRSVVNSI